MTKVLLYSGGFDSVATDMLWQPDVRVFVDMGTDENAIERQRLDPGVAVVDLPLAQWERPDKIIPMRNMMLVTLASLYGEQVALAATAGDRVLDKSVEFATMATDILTYLWQPQHWTDGREILVVLPVKHLTKRQIVGELLARDIDIDWFIGTFHSCYSGQVDECGVCKPCTRNWIALACHGIDTNPVTHRFVEANVDNITAGRGDQERQDAMDALKAVA